MSIIKIEQTRHVAPNGRAYLQFKPVLKPDCCCEGALSFAVWQSWEDEPQTHTAAKDAAMANARQVLQAIINHNLGRL